MDFIESQKDMNTSYIGGATGVLVSGVVWLLAGVIGITVSSVAAMITLFIGGTLIFPLSVVLSKLLSASGKHQVENSLRHLALETLPLLFAGLLIAFYVAQLKMSLFFAIMLLTIGARYFAFHTLYGRKEYWFLGGLLMLGGIGCVLAELPFIAGAFIGGALEVLFAVIIFSNYQAHKRTNSNN